MAASFVSWWGLFKVIVGPRSSRNTTIG
jgi:hypothetical protein